MTKYNTCDHGDDKPATYLNVFDLIGEIYMCECGALLDIDKRDAYDGDKTRAMTPAELTECIQELIDEKLKTAKSKIVRAVEEA